jgi:hypothetical protein
MAEMFSENELENGSNTEADASGSSEDGDDAADTDDREESTEDADGDDGASGEEEDEESDDADDSETTDEDADPDHSEAGKETAKGTSPGAPRAILDALKKAAVPAGILKRINKAFEHSQTYRAQAEELSARLADAPEPIVLTPTDNHPLSDVTTADELAQRQSAAEAWLDWCAENPDGGTVGKGDKAEELTAEDVKVRRQWANKVLRQAPAREKWIEARAQFRDHARKTFPEMFRKGTPEYRAAEDLLKGTPELVRQPDYEMSIAYMVRGLKYSALESQGYTVALIPPDKKAKGKAAASSSPTASAAGRPPAKAPVPKPRQPGNSKPAPAPATPAKASLDALQAKVRQTRSESDLDDLLAAELAA